MYELENLRNKPEFVDDIAENVSPAEVNKILSSAIAGWRSHKYHHTVTLPKDGNLFSSRLRFYPYPQSRFKQVKSYLDYYAGRIAWPLIFGLLVYEGIRMALALGIGLQ